MKLFYRPGACSLSPHIVLREIGASFDLVEVDLMTKKTKAGENFLDINPKGQVPALLLDDGTLLTEGSVIVQYIADLAPASGLIPAFGSMERYRAMEWLNFIGSELHKGFTPLFNPKTPDDYRAAAKQNLANKFAILDRQLTAVPYLTGEHLSVADIYAFVVLSWSPRVGVDLAPYPHIAAFQKRIAQRPAVQATLAAEGLA